MFLALAGLLLIMPGFISDAIALLLLIPLVRRGVARWGLRRLLKQAEHLRVNVFESKIEGGADGAPPGTAGSKGPVIDGEFERVDEKATGPHRERGRDRV
jgi:UPF0716 protein FxsA